MLILQMKVWYKNAKNNTADILADSKLQIGN